MGKSQKTILIDICEYWNNRKQYETSKHLAKHFKKNSTTIVKYLKIGCNIGLCEYDPKKEVYDSRKK